MFLLGFSKLSTGPTEKLKGGHEGEKRVTVYEYILQDGRDSERLIERNISHMSMRMHMDAADWVVSKDTITNYCFRTLFFILPWVPEVFLACSGNFRFWPKADTSRPKMCRPSGHYTDLTETGNRARKVSGTQGIFI